MKRHQIWWQFALFVAVCTAAVYSGAKFDDEMTKFMPESNPHTSTFNIKPSGYSGFFELVKKVGLKCRRWQYAYRRLGEAKGMLVLIGPSETPQDFEIDQMLSWVKRGNKLIYLDGFNYSYSRHILTKLGLDAHDSHDSSGKLEPRVTISEELPEFSFVPHLKLSSDTRLDGGKSLVNDDSGTLMAVVKHGKGEILLGVVPTIASNKHFGDRDDWGNLQFLVNWMGTADGEILFDEICHGYNQATNVFVYLGRGPAGLIALQALIILVVSLMSAAQRFGSIDTVSNPRKISSLEYINGLANTFRRARAADLAWDVLNHSFRARLCKALGVSSHEGNEKLVQVWCQATGGKADELSAFLDSSSAALEKAKMTEEELIALTSACDKISEQSRDLFATGRGKSY